MKKDTWYLILVIIIFIITALYFAFFWIPTCALNTINEAPVICLS